MDTLILTELLGLQGYFIENYKVSEKKVFFYLERESHPICPSCECEHAGAIKDKREQLIKDLPIFDFQVFLYILKERFKCKCGYSGYEKIQWLSRYSRTTIRLNKWLYKFCKVMAVMDVAKLFGFAKETIFRIDKEGIQEELRKVNEFLEKNIGLPTREIKATLSNQVQTIIN